MTRIKATGGETSPRPQLTLPGRADSNPETRDSDPSHSPARGADTPARREAATAISVSTAWQARRGPRQTRLESDPSHWHGVGEPGGLCAND